MLRNYFKTTFRNLQRNKTFSIINIAGLSIGTLCCLYILLFVGDQYSYDRQHRAAQDIYRVNTDFGQMGNDQATSSPPIVPAMKKDFPEVQQWTRLFYPAQSGKGQHLLQWKEKSFYESGMAFVDSTFFDVFAYHFVNGSPAQALTQPYTAVLLKPVADKLFGNEDPVGKVITIDNDYGKHEFTVTGVVDESLGKSHIHANFFVAMNSNGDGAYLYRTQRWAGDNMAACYVRLRPGADPSILEKKLPAFLEKYGGDQLKEMGMHKRLMLQPVTAIHTTAGIDMEVDRTMSTAFLNILLSIAILIQVIACINFMNLSTARAAKRAKEVGVRKVLGAEKGQLIKQFLGESFLMALMGVCIALPLLLLTLPMLNQITQADVSISALLNLRMGLVFAGLVLVTGIIAGSYPAFYLSAFNSIKVLKGNFTNQVSAAGIRRGLVVFQFVLSIGLVTSITVIHSQLYHIAHTDLGFNKEQQLVFGFHTPEARARIKPFANDLRQLSEVKGASNSSYYLSQQIGNDMMYALVPGDVTKAPDVHFITCDEHFVQTEGIQLVSGRDFRQQDSNRVLINESYCQRMGLDVAKAPGTRLYPGFGGNSSALEIVGVMKDFNTSSLRDDVSPVMLRYGPNGLQGWGLTLSYLSVRVATADYRGLLEKISSIWHKDLPEEPFVFHFLRDEIQRQYESEMILGNIINTFTGMAMFISCLGLFGLAAFSAEQRTKEIGVRKVLGASVASIVRLLSGGFVRLVAVAFVIASPVAWWAMNKWLESFAAAYRIQISWWMLGLAGSVALLVTLLTVGIQAVRAAFANPVDSLRIE
jgi:putative ABC transport system permease protein